MHLNLKFIARRLTRTCIQPNSTSTAHNNVAARDAVAAHLPPLASASGVRVRVAGV